MRNQFKALLEKYEQTINSTTTPTPVKGPYIYFENNNTIPIPVKGRYIYFVNDRKLYQLSPYKQIQPTGMIMTMAKNWTRATVMQGEDVRDMLGKEVNDMAAWYVVDGAPEERTFVAYIGT